MIKPVIISQKDARKITLHSQGLQRLFNNSLDVIKQLSYIQIDTISVTERAHNHVLFNRNPTFKQKELTQLMDDKSIFEYWSHAAAYLPMDDFRYSLYRKEQYKIGVKHWFPRDKKVDKYVMDRIKSEGALQSKDFDNPKKTNGWYEWKPAKIALTNLFMDGSLMISNRKGFQKIFDLSERVLPNNINITIPTIEEYCKHLIIKAIKAHGLVTLNEIVYLRKGTKPILKQMLTEMIESHEIVTVTINNINEVYYSNHQLLNSIIEQEILDKQLHILNPFDNILIQRKRIKDLFDFDYQIECYVPEKKRKFGYYALPVLYGDNFVARLDAKADRKTAEFTIKGIWFEEGFDPTHEFYKKFSKELQSYSFFCGCESIKIDNVYPNGLKKELKSFI